MIIEQLTGYVAAGGQGSRLRPHTLETPKPILPMGTGRRRVIDDSLGVAEKYCSHTFVTTYYQARQVEDYVKGRPRVTILHDSQAVGDGGSIIEHSRKILSEEGINGSFLIMPGDHILENFPIPEFFAHHERTGADVTLMVTPPRSFGEYVVMDRGQAKQIISTARRDSMSTIGIYLISNRYLFNWINTQLQLGWNKQKLGVTDDIIHPAIHKGHVETFCMSDESYWDDAGTVSRYWYNNMRLSKNKNVIDERASIDPTARLNGCVIIGKTKINGSIVLQNAIVSQDSENNLQITKIEK